MYKIQASIVGKEDWYDLVDLPPSQTREEAFAWLNEHNVNYVDDIYDFRVVEIS